MRENENPKAAIQLSGDAATLECSGDWTLLGIDILQPKLESLAHRTAKNAALSARQIAAMDSAGALLFQDFLARLQALGKNIVVTDLDARMSSLLKLVEVEHKLIHFPPPTLPIPGFLYLLGKWVYFKWTVLVHFLAFVGQVAITFARSLWQPSRIRWRATLKIIDETGYQALPIVALLTFLVGVVLTYQIALELESYNADIFIVDITGMSILREFGPLITAIIAAGRTSTAFTAQIGTMKVNEEIDALQTMGVSPTERLVMPKLIGLLIALPLLTVWADVFGVLGSMVMAKYQMGIAFYGFLERFQHAIPVRHYIAGLVKAPVFALIIATVGAFQGFQVAGTADSVGEKTTQSAVQSIFLIIIVDAFFSVIFSWRGI